MNGRLLRVFAIWVVIVQYLIISSSASWLGNWSTSIAHRSKRQACRKMQFQCNNGVCIDDTLICDGAGDCPDGSDETKVACVNTSCPSYSFPCDYGGCVDADAKCNGKIDCYDGSDERGCPGSDTSNCKSSEYQCKYGQCIDILFLCDGKKDCNDGSDETREACASFSCPGFAFRCVYGACIDGDSRCNGLAQCADESDESPDICGSTHPFTLFATPTPTPSSAPSTPECVLPQPPKNGKYIVGSCQPPKCPPPGTKTQVAYLTYTCNPGYSITGSQTAYCEDGNWLSQPPNCSRVSCSPLVSVSRDITCTLKGETVPCKDRMSTRTVADIKCKNYYQQGPELSSYQTVCGSDGKWSRQLTSCNPVCGLRNPEGVPFVSNGVNTKYGEFPWHVGVYRRNKSGTMEQYCGGTLISSRVIISGRLSGT